MDLIKRNSYKACALLVILSGVVALSPKILEDLLSGNRVHFISHPVGAFLGFLLLYISFQLFRRKRLALLISYLAIGSLLLLALFNGHFKSGVLYLITLSFLVFAQSQFFVKSNNLNLKRALYMSGFVVLLAFVYGIVGLYLTDKEMFNHDFSLLESVKYAFIQLMSFDNGLLHPATHQASLYLRTLDLIGLGALVIVVINLFEPVKFELFINNDDIKLAKDILANNSTSTEDFFLIWPQDKHYYFNKSKTSFLAYRVQNGVALVLGGPIGNTVVFNKLLNNFKQMCNENGWLVAIIHSDEDIKKLANKIDLSSIFIGNEALVEIESFCSQTIKDKHFRYVENKALAENLSVEFWQHPHSKANLQQLKRISYKWLELPSRREYGFMMSPYSDIYLKKCDVMVLKQDKKIIAYTNLLPSYLKDSATIDHMRHIQNIPNISMHFLLKSLIVHLKQSNYKWFNLGLSPLAGLKEIEDPILSERLLGVIKVLGSKYYSFEGVEQFKNKFKPIWQPKYILYEGSVTNLIRVTRALSIASAIPKSKSIKKMIYFGLGILASISYLSFMLTYPLGLDVAGFASNLEQRGAAYSWLFIIADVVAGIIICTLAYIGIKQSRKNKSELKYGLLAIGGLGNIFATLAPIRGSAHILHLLFSAISILGFFGAIFLDILGIKNKQKRILLMVLALAMFGVGGIALVTPVFVGGIIQRVQLLFISIYIVVFTNKITKNIK